MRLRLSATLLLVATAACVGPPPAPPAPVRPRFQPAPAPPRPAPLAADWRDWPQTPGTWTYRRDARGTLALFGRAGADAVATLRCDAAVRRLYLSVAGVDVAPMTVRTTSLTRVLAMQPTGATPAYAATALAASDPLLDAIGFSRGRFVLQQPGRAPLVLPAWAEVERVTQDCRG